MAKYSRNQVGSVLKAKDGGADYIKIGKNDVVLKAGSTLRLESQKSQLASLEAAYKAEKLSKEIYEQAKARIEKMPTFVRFEIIQLTEKA